METDKHAAAEEHLAVFKLAGEYHALEITRIREIIRWRSITPLPRSPEFVEGLIDLRGHVIPVVDLRKRLQLEAAPVDRQTRIVVVESGSQMIGLVVDAVVEIVRVPGESVEPVPDLVATGPNAGAFRGVANVRDRLVILLNLERLLHTEEHPAAASLSGDVPEPV